MRWRCACSASKSTTAALKASQLGTIRGVHIDCFVTAEEQSLPSVKKKRHTREEVTIAGSQSCTPISIAARSQGSLSMAGHPAWAAEPFGTNTTQGT